MAPLLSVENDPTSLRGGAIAIVDADADRAGANSRAALEMLGLWDKWQNRLLGVVGTEDAAFLLAQGKARFALLYATDLAANPAFSLAANLPDDAYPRVDYWIGQTHSVQSPSAPRFEAFLRQPAAAARLRAGGLEVQ
jgi:molybdate transport system substrate-binding protein